MPARHRNVCLVTVTSERFLAVTLGSFFKHHPRFAGDVVVLHDALLPEAHRAVLATAFAGLRFEPVSAALCERLTRLATAQPRVKDRLARFYTLDAFRLDGYRKVLFCDSDLLFRASVDDLFEAPDALLCCGLRGVSPGLAPGRRDLCPRGARRSGRRRAHPGPHVQHRLSADRRGARRRGQSCGALGHALAGDVAEHPAYGRGALEPGLYRAADADQFHVQLPAARGGREGLAPADAKVLHFNYPDKPWQPDAMLAWMSGTVSFKSAPAFKLWYDAWVDCLAGAHMRNALGRRDECA